MHGGGIAPLLARTRIYLQRSQTARVTTSLAALCLFLYPASWLFFYHKGETIANFACLIVAALLVSGKARLSPVVAAFCLLLVSAYLATIRADSGFALNLGIPAVALVPAGKRLPLGRVLQIGAALLGCVVVVGAEFYIKHFLFPYAPYPVSPFQLVNNISAVHPLFCVVVALAPWFFTVGTPAP
jgi:hypothetical protein